MILGLLKSFFTSGAVGAVERIASEAIETDMESAEAKALFIKALDPNGKMRRDLSRFACVAYGFYLVITSLLLLMAAFGAGGDLCNAVNGVDVCIARAQLAAETMTTLFLPITGAWSAIVAASFGVNATNTIKGK